MEGKKYDAGKIRLELLPFDALAEVAKVLGFGAEKYGAFNWAQGMDWTRLHGAALRHLTADLQGQDLDPESEMYHLAHLACCTLFLLSYKLRQVGRDDRFKLLPQEQPPSILEKVIVNGVEYMPDEFGIVHIK